MQSEKAMPYSVRLYGVTGLDPLEAEVVEPVWWRGNTLNLPGTR